MDDDDDDADADADDDDCDSYYDHQIWVVTDQVMSVSVNPQNVSRELMGSDGDHAHEYIAHLQYCTKET